MHDRSRYLSQKAALQLAAERGRRAAEVFFELPMEVAERTTAHRGAGPGPGGEVARSAGEVIRRVRQRTSECFTRAFSKGGAVLETNRSYVDIAPVAA